MFLSLISNAPALAVAWILAIMIAMTVHEFSHALVAKFKGDRTGEREGRLTLNPLAHVDLAGFIPLLLLGFGWAKPVPYNPYNLKNPRWDSVMIGLAGPFANLVMASIAALALRALAATTTVSALNLLTAFLFLTILINLFLLFFNLIPVHPLDGSKLFFAIFDAPQYAALRNAVAVYGPQVLFFLVIMSIVGFNVFGFIATPAFATCDALLGTNCLTFYALIFGSL
jgi:Zn-dependent protease